MNNNPSFGGLHAEARTLIEEHQTPLLCFYLDKESNEVKMIADSESHRKVVESKLLEKVEEMLKSSLQEKNKLKFYDDHTLCQNNNYKDPVLLPLVSYDKLPTEILRTIFKHLRPEDLKTLLLVSQTWKSVADDPLLWTGFGLPTKCTKNKDLLESFLSEGSLSSKLQHLKLGKFDFNLNDSYFESFMGLNISSIEITPDVDLSNVSIELLATLVNDCKEFSIRDNYTLNFNTQKKFCSLLEAIIKKMSETSRVKSLKLQRTRLTSIAADVVSEAFKNLTSIDFYQVEISSDAIQAIFKSIRIDAKVKIMVEDESWIDCLDAILHRLEGFSFHAGPLMNGQLRRWIDILDSSCKLEYLELGEDVDVRQIPSELLVRVVNKVQRVNLQILDRRISPNQLREIFKGILGSDSKLKHLELCTMDLKVISSELFAKAANKLESFYYGFCDVSESQVLEMFRVMSLGTNLKNLGECPPCEGFSFDEMEHIELVDPVTLAKAVNNLESLHLDRGANSDDRPRLTLAQLVAIIKQLNIKTSLKKIWRFSDDNSYKPEYEIVYI